MDMIEAMAIRVSTRSFDGERMTTAEAGRLRAMLASAAREATPFGHEIRLALHEGEDEGKPVRLGTYGLISGVSAYIVAAVVPGSGSMEDAGYIIENAVLQATAMGWASCWIGGLFSRSKAAEIIGLRSGEIIPAVIALGRPAAKRSVVDRIVTGAAKSRTRKPLEDIAFAVDGATFVEPWLGVLRAVQGAPSASNKQPWRIVRLSGGDEWLMFLDEDKVYNNSLGDAHLQNLDTGIGMRHFMEAAASAGLKGRWIPVSGPEGDPETQERLGHAVRYGEARNWIPIAFWYRHYQQ